MTSTSSPAASRLFFYRVVQLGWIVLVALVYRALPTLMRSAGKDAFDVVHGVIAVVWLAFTGAEVFFLWGLAREAGAHPAARLLRTTLGLGWVSVALSLLNVVGALGGPDLLHFTGDLGRFVAVGFQLGIALAFDVVFWISLEQLLGDRLLPALRPAFYVLRIFSLLLGSLNMLPFAIYKSWLLAGIIGTLFPWLRLLVTIAWNVVVIVALNTLAQSAPAPGAVAGGPMAPPPESDGKTDLIVGALWLGGGLLVTFLSYSAASSGGGGRYVVTTGAIAVGAVRIVRGLVRLARA